MTEPRVWADVTTIGDLIDRAAATSHGDALVFPGTRTSYPEFAQLSTRYARSLWGLGVRRGDHVGILMPNCVEFLVALVAAAKLGAVVVPINGRFKEHELSYVIGHADVRTLLTGTAPGAVDFAGLIAEVFPDGAGQDPNELSLKAAPALRQLVDMSGERDGFLTHGQLMAAGEAVDEEVVAIAQERVRVRDVAMLMYTSGTTARPKGCLLSHEALVRNAVNIARLGYRLTDTDCFWNPLPLFHIGGVVPLLICASAGCPYVHAGHFDADVALAQIEDERATVLYPTFETIWLAILDHPRFEKADLSAVRIIHNVGVNERLAQMQERMPWAAQITAFGATEISSHLTLPLPEDPPEIRLTTLGRPLNGMEAKVIDPGTGDERPQGEVGELCIRGYACFEGYYKEPELTAAAVDRDGWFHTGDLACLDPEGRLCYRGRLKDMLKVGGENVSALEIEDYVVGHPATEVVQVVAAPDARYSEVPAAFVQVRRGHQVTEAELIAFCHGRIASFKVPRYVRFVEEWPMSGTKIQKFVLRDMIAADLRDRGITEAPPIGALVANQQNQGAA
jgi:fatty-acyl-CoA synthase